MARVHCPRCGTAVEVPAGVRPVCPTCGFGSAAPRPVEPRPLSPPPPSVRPAPSIPSTSAAAAPTAPSLAASDSGVPRRPGRAVAIAAVAVVVLASAGTGAYFLLKPGPAMSDADARATVRTAMAELEQAMESIGLAGAGGGLPTATPALDDLRKITVEARGNLDGRPEGGGVDAGAGSPFGGEEGSFSLGVEWGTAGTVRLDVTFHAGILRLAVIVHCVEDGVVVTVGHESARMRPSGGDDPCSGLDPGAAAAFLAGPASGVGFDFTPPAGMAVDVGSDSVEATWTDGGNETTVRLAQVDKLWRVESVVVESAQLATTLALDYGARRVLAVPEAPLDPARILASPDFDAGTYTWTVVESDQAPSLAEFEVRIQEPMADPGDAGQEPREPVVTARFAFTAAAGTRSGEFAFRYDDADGDGRVTAGDSFTVTDPSWQDPWEHDVVVYDVAADGAVNTSRLTPGPGLLLAALALAIARLLPRSPRGAAHKGPAQNP